MPSQNGSYQVAATAKTPAFLLAPSDGLMEITGCSIMENADKAYGPFYEALEAYLASPAPRTTVRVSLTYFNSSSAKYVLDLLKRLEDAHMAGATKAVLEWHHGPDDLDMMEAGRDYKSLLEFPVKLVEGGT